MLVTKTRQIATMVPWYVQSRLAQSGLVDINLDI